MHASYLSPLHSGKTLLTDHSAFPLSLDVASTFFLKLFLQAAATNWLELIRSQLRGFSGGSVVETPPANAGDVGLIPDLGGSHD